MRVGCRSHENRIHPSTAAKVGRTRQRVMQLKPNDLLFFARVVDEGSFSKAAQRLAVPVSTVSRRITALETALGERLILRTTRKLTVTELGQAVLEHASRAPRPPARWPTTASSSPRGACGSRWRPTSA